MTRLRLICLEDRAVPAVVTWDGGPDDGSPSVGDLWTSGINWVGDVAPQPGDGLVFPTGARQLTATNDFATGTGFDFMQLNGLNYAIGGNAVALSAGITAALPSGTSADTDPRLALPLALTADQTFASTFPRGFAIDAPIDLGGSTLSLAVGDGTIALNGVISGTGGVRTLFGLGVARLSAANTYTGATQVGGGTLQMLGSLAGPVSLQGGFFTGHGSIGPLTAINGTLQPARHYPVPPGDAPGILNTGDLSLSSGTFATFVIAAAGPSQLRVTGSTQVGGFLSVTPDTRLQPGTSYTLIANDGTDPVTGQFVNLPEGGTVTFGPVPLKVTYRGGDGNDVAVTAVSQNSYAVGAGAGGLPQVNVYDAAGGLIRSILVYDASFRGGVHVATGDVTGDGVPDTVTAPGAGGGPHVKVFDGVTGALVREFLAYDESFRGGVNLALARVTVSGPDDIVTGAGPGGGPHVKVFTASGATAASFLAYDASFLGGVSVAAVDGFPIHFGTVPGQVITGAGPGGGPHVKVFTVPSFGQVTSGSGFFAYDASFRGGVNVAYDPLSLSVVTAPGAGGGPVVRGFSPDGVMRYQFLAYPGDFRGGVTVAVHPLGAGLTSVILTGPGSGGGPLVLQWEGTTPALVQAGYAFDPTFLGGVYVG